MDGIIKSIGSSQTGIIKDILKLHCNNRDIDCDPTYSKGNFYKDGINEPIHKFDLSPVIVGVEEADCRSLPLEDESVDTLMFDPPFVISKGPSLSAKKEGSNIISSRFSSFENYETLLNMYYDSLSEFYRVLKDKGIIIFKCQDTVSGGKQYITHAEIIYQCITSSDFCYYVKDLFILVAKNRMSSGKWKVQRHARKFHSYFLVLQKDNL